MTPATMTTNAPVGPPIWTREPPSAEIRKPGDDRGDQSLARAGAAGDAERHGQRQRDDRDGEAGDQVGAEVGPAIAFAQGGDQLRRERVRPKRRQPTHST